MQHISPSDWPRPRGYSNGIIAEGKVFFLAGVIGWNEKEEFASDDLVDQFRQALLNIRAILEAGDSGPEHITRMTWFVTDMDRYRNSLPEIGAIYKEIIGKNFPVMACIGVSALVEKRAKIEIEVTAMIA
ncbi:MAG: enamine deaminase RidA [Alphaproteobacteria bacterium]|nr:MAG: enamine deaminase RidA [Alphaproteobacteria bacterium]